MDYVSSKSFESDSDPKCSHSLDQFAQHCHTCDAIQHAWCLHGRERCEMLATDSYFWRVKARVQLSTARDRYPIIAWSRPIGQALQVPGPTNRIEVNSAPPFSKADVNTIPWAYLWSVQGDSRISQAESCKQTKEHYKCGDMISNSVASHRPRWASVAWCRRCRMAYQLPNEIVCKKMNRGSWRRTKHNELHLPCFRCFGNATNESLAIFSQLRSSPTRGRAGCGVRSCYSPRGEWPAPAEYFPDRFIEPSIFRFDSSGADLASRGVCYWFPSFVTLSDHFLEYNSQSGKLQESVANWQ